MVRLSDQGAAKSYGDDPSGVRGLDGCLNFDGWQMGDRRASADPRPPDSPDGNRQDAPGGVHFQTTAGIGVRGDRDPVRHNPDTGDTPSLCDGHRLHQRTVGSLRLKPLQGYDSLRSLDPKLLPPCRPVTGVTHMFGSFRVATLATQCSSAAAMVLLAQRTA